jgi:hypothetical protein
MSVDLHLEREAEEVANQHNAHEDGKARERLIDKQRFQNVGCDQKLGPKKYAASQISPIAAVVGVETAAAEPFDNGGRLYGFRAFPP